MSNQENLSQEEKEDREHMKNGCQLGWKETVEEIIEDYDGKCLEWLYNWGGNAEETPLHIAICCGQLEIAELLISHKADVNAKSKGVGRTPLSSAKNQGAIDLLLKNNADLNAKDQMGYTALHLTQEVEVVSSLLKHHPDLNAKSIYDETPLHMACTETNVEVMKLLLENGADVRALDQNGRTPLHLACDSYGDNMFEAVELLLKYDPEVDLKDKFGQSPLDFFPTEGDGGVGDLLREAQRKRFIK